MRYLFSEAATDITNLHVHALPGEIEWKCVPNGEAAHLKLELFNDIHGDSGAILYQTVSSTSLQPRLATVGFTGTNGTGTPSNTQNNTVNDIHDLQNKTDYVRPLSQSQSGYGWTEVQCSVQL